MSKAAGDESDLALGLGIEPLDIVDPYEQWSFTGESREDTLCRDSDRPLVIIAHTRKGYGISWMDLGREWHLGHLVAG